MRRNLSFVLVITLLFCQIFHSVDAGIGGSRSGSSNSFQKIGSLVTCGIAVTALSCTLLFSTGCNRPPKPLSAHSGELISATISIKDGRVLKLINESGETRMIRSGFATAIFTSDNWSGKHYFTLKFKDDSYKILIPQQSIHDEISKIEVSPRQSGQEYQFRVFSTSAEVGERKTYSTRKLKSSSRKYFENRYVILQDRFLVKVMKDGEPIATIDLKPQTTREIFDSSTGISREDYELYK